MSTTPITRTLRLRSALQGGFPSLRVPLEATSMEAGSDGPVDGYWVDMKRDGSRRFIPADNVVELIHHKGTFDEKPEPEAEPSAEDIMRAEMEADAKVIEEAADAVTTIGLGAEYHLDTSKPLTKEAAEIAALAAGAPPEQTTRKGRRRRK